MENLTFLNRPAQLWRNEDKSIDFIMVHVVSKTAAKGSERAADGSAYYEVCLTPNPELAEGLSLMCPCPGFEYREKCRHVTEVREALIKEKNSTKTPES